MTEELENKAEEYATQKCNYYYGERFSTEHYKFGNYKYERFFRWKTYKQAYIDGAKIRDKEVAELKKQLSEKECFPQKKDGTIDLCEVMKENEKLSKMLELAINDVYEKTMVIHRTEEEFKEVYRQNLKDRLEAKK